MRLREKILEIITSSPGSTDRELTDLISGKNSGPQAVNSECRLLQRQRLLRRDKGEDGRIRNFLADPTVPAQSGEAWTQAEITAAVHAYVDMLAIQEQGEALNKAKVNRELRAGPLAGRSASAVERRMQNITAVLQQLGQPTLKGYAPLGNVGELNWGRIVVAAGPLLGTLPDAIGILPDVGAQPLGSERPSRTQRSAIVFSRDQKVVAWVLKRAGGYCEGCLHPAPFVSVAGTPFLEVHHVTPLAAGGADSPQNTVALCPNCHRKAHYAGNDVLREFDKTLRAYLAELDQPRN